MVWNELTDHLQVVYGAVAAFAIVLVLTPAVGASARYLRLIERRRRRSEFELLDDETLLAGVADEDALQEQEGMLLRMEVEQVIGCLSVADRQLLALRYERDLTQPEVARMLGIPEGTVKIRLHRLRGRLRKALDAPV